MMFVLFLVVTAVLLLTCSFWCQRTTTTFVSGPAGNVRGIRDSMTSTRHTQDSAHGSTRHTEI